MFDIVELVKTVGYVGIFAIVFAESGLFFGFFFPGDSLLFTAGLLASQGFLDFYILAPLVFAGAVLGDTVGYMFGRKVGPAIFKNEDSLFFNKKNIERTKIFYEKYGSKTIILARFVPIVRTFAPIFAGVGHMRYKTFLTYNLIGGALWGLGVTGIAYYLGSIIPNLERYLVPIVLLIIFVSLIPLALEYLAHRKNSKK
ncbi:MAG: VTT domain-containing protein [Candidatus Azambacteria bacterium]|nr:VTT domain-containing protein [Candidatus Azambacteria bacterium]